MTKFELYHLLSFVLLYLYATNNVYKIDPPKVEINDTVYLSSLLLPIMILLSNNNLSNIDQTVVIMSSIIFTYTLPQVISLSEVKENSRKKIVRFAHPFMIVLVLMLLYSQSVDMKYMYPMYAGMIAFSIISVTAGKRDFKYILNDYVLCHLLFFFTKR